MSACQFCASQDAMPYAWGSDPLRWYCVSCVGPEYKKYSVQDAAPENPPYQPLTVTLLLSKDEIRRLLEVARREGLGSVVFWLEEMISHTPELEIE